MSIPQRFKNISFIFSTAVAIVGLLVLTGWIGHITFLKSIFPEWISMKANAAICFLLAGITLILVNREKKNTTAKWVASFLSFIIFLTGTITLFEYIFQFDAGIDELFFRDTGGAYTGLPPGRQSPTSAVYFMLFGFCYLPGSNRWVKIPLFQILHIVSGIIILAALMSYLLGTYIIAGISLKFIFVIHSTLSFLLLILAVLFSQPEVGFMKQASSNSSGGKAIRNTIPLLVFFFIVLGWLRFKGERAGLYNAELGMSIFIILMIIIMGYLIFLNAVSFTKSEFVLKESEERLIQANKNLELAEQQASLGNWEFEPGNRFTHWSDQMFRLFEMAPAEMAPSNEEFLNMVHPDDRASITMYADRLMEQENKESNVFRTNQKIISLKYLNPTWQVVKDEKGNPVKYFGTLQDITEKIEAKEALRQREELFSKAFHSKVFGLAIVNQERRVIDINNTLADLIEYSREEMIGKTSLEIGITHPGYIKKRDELLLLLLQKGNIENYELEMTTRYGKPLILLLSVEPLSLNSFPHWLISLVDITAKRKAEKELAESENRLRTILDTEPECVKIIDQNEELTYINPAGLAMIEADSFEKVKGKKGFSTINEPYLKDFHKLLADVFSGTPGKMEYEITGFKGIHRWMETHIVPLDAEDNKITSLLAVTRDISERKKYEQQLTESEQRLNRAEKMGNLGHGYFDIEKNRMHLSAGLYKIFGVSPETFSHTIEGLKSVIHPGDYLIQDKAVDTLFISGIAEVEFRILRPDGEVRNVFFKTVLTKNNDGSFANSFTTALDITERKKAEEEIKKAIERYELIGKATNDAVWEWDLQTNEIWGNDSFYQLYGLNRHKDDLNKLEPYARTHPDDVLKLKSSLAGAFNEHAQSTEVEFRFRMPDDSYKTFLDRAFISYDKNGQPNRLIGAMLDITESKKAEEQIKAYNVQLRRLAANLQDIREEERRRIGREIHDELGQSLTVLKMRIDRLKEIEGYQKSLDESITEIIKQADECINSSRQISTDLRPPILDDLGLIAALEWQGQEFGKRTRIKTVFETDLTKLELPPDFAIAIFRIFQESLTNVARHAEATKVLSNLSVQNEGIVLKITDNGKGFDTAIVNTTKSLGLAGMKERALLLNGTYKISSIPGKGTKITAIIPLPAG